MSLIFINLGLSILYQKCAAKIIIIFQKTNLLVNSIHENMSRSQGLLEQLLICLRHSLISY